MSMLGKSTAVTISSPLKGDEVTAIGVASRGHITKRYAAGPGKEVESFDLESDNLENRGIRCYYNML